LTAGLRLKFQSTTRIIILTQLETTKGGTPKKEMVEKYKLEKLTDKYDYFKSSTSFRLLSASFFFVLRQKIRF